MYPSDNTQWLLKKNKKNKKTFVELIELVGKTRDGFVS